MFHEYRELITELKTKDVHFAKVFDRHNELDQKIKDVTEGREHMDKLELDKLKKEKLLLKDEAYAILSNYEKGNK